MAKKRGIDLAKADTKQLKRINAIAKASAQLFSTKGYLQTSIDDVARAVRATKGGVFYYFETKADILYFICLTYIDLDLEGLEHALVAIGDPTEKIRFIIFRHIQHYAAQVPAAKTLLNEAYNLPNRLFRKVRAQERRYFEIVRNVLSQWAGSNCRKGVATTLAFTLFGMMNWTYSWYDPKGEITSEELCQLLYEAFTNGVNGALAWAAGAVDRQTQSPVAQKKEPKGSGS